jgi:hypothetical protein
MRPPWSSTEAGGKRQPQAGAFVLAARGAIHLDELLEDTLLVRRRDADAGVGHHYFDVVSHQPSGGLHGPARRRELYRVRQQVVEHLLQLALVSLQGRDGGIDLGSERQLLLLSQRVHDRLDRPQ